MNKIDAVQLYHHKPAEKEHYGVYLNLSIFRTFGKDVKVHNIKHYPHDTRTNRPARLVAFLLAWLSRQPGAQLHRRTAQAATGERGAACAPFVAALAFILWILSGFIPGA